MGIISPDRLFRHLPIITNALLKRGFLPDPEEVEWEIHGPHGSGMPYVVYVGHAVPASENTKCRFCYLSWKDCKSHQNCIPVAIYPRAVYELGDTSEWNCSECRIRILVLKTGISNRRA